MARRFKSHTMKFGVPLAVPGSRHVERCYGLHGKGYGGRPTPGSAIVLILINEERQLKHADGFYPNHHKFRSDAVTYASGWRILGWRMADGSMPYGGLGAVDPELAQIDYLSAPNPPTAALHEGPPLRLQDRQA